MKNIGYTLLFANIGDFCVICFCYFSMWVQNNVSNAGNL